MHLDAGTLTSLIAQYGYLLIFIVVAGESAGVPVPGETVLISAAIYAGTTHRLDIFGVVAAAACGAILGDNLGFWVGRKFGPSLLLRIGPKIGLDARRQKLGQYLFQRYGGSIVFFGRFVAVLRAFSAMLAGVNRLSPMRFFVFNATGGVVWAGLFGFGGYLLGAGVHDLEGPVGKALLIIALIGAFLAWRFYKRNEELLLQHAEREMSVKPPA